MSFDWSTYLDIAKLIKTWSISTNLDEAKFRTSISRSYYSALNLTKKTLESKKGVNFKAEDIKRLVKARGSHRFLLQLLYTSDSGLVKNLAAELEELKEMREDADYRTEDYERLNGTFQSFAHTATFKAQGIITDLVIFNDSDADIKIDKLRDL